MARRIRLGCPQCGEVELTAEKIRLDLWRGPGRSTYSFSCPLCRTEVVKAATPMLLLALRNHGVKPDVSDAPPDPKAPPFVYDDLLDFHLELRSDERVAAFLEAQPDVAGRRPARAGSEATIL